MAKNKKEIQYPTQEWLDTWVDKWLDDHPNEKVTDFTALNEEAESAWWDNEVNHKRPTPFDLTPEQEKEAKKARSTGTRKSPANSTRKVTKDANKVKIIEEINEFLTKIVENCEISNAGQTISFNFNENSYSLTLTKHRNSKK